MDSLTHVYGLTLLPLPAETPAPPCPTARGWGERESTGGGAADADWSGHAADAPELAQRAWAVV